MTKQEKMDALLDELARSFAEDESLHEQLEFPPLPPLPEEPGEVLAIFIPKKSKPRAVRKVKRGRGAS